MKTMFCPFPITKILEISTSCQLAPFSWAEVQSKYTPWTGEPALVFFPDIPTIPESAIDEENPSERICILEIDLSNTPNLPLKSNSSGDGILELHQPVPIVPGATHILTENQAVESEAIYLLRQSVTSKYSDTTARSLIRILANPGRHYDRVSLATKSVSLDLVTQRIVDRKLGVDLLSFAKKGHAQLTPGWHDLRAFIVELRSKIAAQRTERNLNSSSPLRRFEENIMSIEHQLTRLGALSLSSLISNWGKAILRDNKNVCERGIEVVFDGLFKSGSSRIVNSLKEEAFAWLASSNQESLLACYARFRHDPLNIDKLVEFGKAVRRECDDQDVEASINVLAKQNDEELIQHSEFATEEREIINSITSAIISFRPEISAAELRRRGVSPEERNELIRHIHSTLLTQNPSMTRSSFWSEWQVMQTNSLDNFKAYITGRPNFGPLMMNFLIFIMNPTDEKRLVQQQASWSCKSSLLGRIFQTALLGYSACQGETFHALWGAVSKDPQFWKRAFTWFERIYRESRNFADNPSNVNNQSIIGNLEAASPGQNHSKYGIGKDSPEDTNSDDLLSVVTVSSNEFEEQIISLLAQNPKGLRKKDIIGKLKVDEAIVDRIIDKLKHTKRVEYSGRGSSGSWHLTR